MDYKAWFEGMVYERAREDDAINELFACIANAEEGGHLTPGHKEHLEMTLLNLVKKSRGQVL